MPSLGHHYLFDFYQCLPSILNHREQLRGILLEAAKKAQATLVKDFFHQFEPQGLSGVLIISESHLAIHTWPENRFAAIDLFTCKKDLNVSALESYLLEALGASRVERRELKRGETVEPPSSTTSDTYFA